MNEQRKPFLVFSAYRTLLFAGLCLVLVFFSVLGPELGRFYFGEGNTYHYSSRGALAVHFIDVGQGDCAALQLPDGRVGLIDGGDVMYYTRVKTYLKTRILTRDNKLDFIISTHSHADHCGGLVSILNDFEVKTVYRPHNKSNSILEPSEEALAPLQSSQVYADFITAAYEQAETVEFVEKDISITDEENYNLYFHTPTLKYINGLKSGFDDFNEISPLITLSYGNSVFMLTGDAGEKSESEFMISNSATEIDFLEKQVYLKVGHHGSKSGTTSDFLDFIKPVLAVISLGANNVYGFPDAQLMSRLENCGINNDRILLTGEVGNIVLRIASGNLKVFLGFDNPADLSFLILLGFITLFCICFFNVNFRTVSKDACRFSA